MAESRQDINILKLLIGIKEDVSSIKTDMTNFKESQKREKEATLKEITSVREDFKKELSNLETRLTGKISSVQSVQNNLVGDVDTLKHFEDSKNAQRWKTTITYILTAISGMIAIKIPDFILFLMNLHH